MWVHPPFWSISLAQRTQIFLDVYIVTSGTILYIRNLFGNTFVQNNHLDSESFFQSEFGQKARVCSEYLISERRPFIDLKCYDAFLRTALTRHGPTPALSEKLPKWHFLTHACNSKIFLGKLLLLKCFENATKWLYPKNVSGSVQVLLKQWIKVDKLDYFHFRP